MDMREIDTWKAEIAFCMARGAEACDRNDLARAEHWVEKLKEAKRELARVRRLARKTAKPSKE